MYGRVSSTNKKKHEIEMHRRYSDLYQKTEASIKALTNMLKQLFILYKNNYSTYKQCINEICNMQTNPVSDYDYNQPDIDGFKIYQWATQLTQENLTNQPGRLKLFNEVNECISAIIFSTEERIATLDRCYLAGKIYQKQEPNHFLALKPSSVVSPIELPSSPINTIQNAYKLFTPSKEHPSSNNTPQERANKKEHVPQTENTPHTAEQTQYPEARALLFKKGF